MGLVITGDFLEKIYVTATFFYTTVSPVLNKLKAWVNSNMYRVRILSDLNKLWELSKNFRDVEALNSIRRKFNHIVWSIPKLDEFYKQIACSWVH